MTARPTSGVPESPRARRSSAPSWLDARLVIGVGLVLAAVLLGARVVSSARQTAPVVVARRDLAAGTVLSANDLAVVQAKLPASGQGRYPRGVADAVGRRLSRPVLAGELLPVAALDADRGQTTVTVPLAAAAAPELHKGQRIELWLSTVGCPALVLLPSVAVQAVRVDDTAFGSDGDGQDVTISVAPPLADRVVAALAIEDAQLRAGILEGSSVPDPDGALADLRGCLAAR